MGKPSSFDLMPVQHFSYLFQIIPLSIPSDGEELVEQSPSIDPAQRAYVHLSGYAANCDQREATFNINISQYISMMGPTKSGSKTKPTASFTCTVLDSPRYEKFGKLVPQAKQYVSVTGFLANVIVASDSKRRNSNKFTVEVDNVVFGPAGSTAVSKFTNDLDSESIYL